MTSRFMNLAVKHMNGGQIPFSIHRINPANLFYPTGSRVLKQVSAEVTPMDVVQLPTAAISFDWPCPPVQHYPMEFMAFGSNRDKIIAMDSIGRSYLYDDALRSICADMPKMPQRMMKPLSFAVGENGLFVLSDINHQFVALMDGYNPNSMFLPKPSWYWQSLQPPPFPSRSYDEEDIEYPYEIGAYTVVGNSQIVVSTLGAGTFSFDTETGAWKKAGEWVLPFRGRAEYVPEHNLWFGFSDKDKELCASDLTAVSPVRPPVPQKLCKDLVWPEHWRLRSTHLLPLGSSKLCITRFFLTFDEDKLEDMAGYKPDTTNHFAVLVGAEVISDEGRLRIIQHKSKCYNFGRNLADPL